jgi:hypothetical protein
MSPGRGGLSWTTSRVHARGVWSPGTSRGGALVVHVGGRRWPRSWAERPLGDGDDDQDEPPGPVASLTSDATVRDASEACMAFRPVVSVLLRKLGDFLYTLKAGPAGGLPALSLTAAICAW